MKEELIKAFSEYGIELSEKMCDQFEKYYNFLIEENEKFNLTAITQQDEVIFKHFLDSVLPINEIKVGASVIDIGTGAGFPGLPLKIIRTDLKVVLVDSLQKRVNFLNECIKLLDLQNVIAVHARAEDYIKTQREKFDYAVSRAVAQTNTLVEYLLPYVKVGGKVILYKSIKAQEEIEEASKAIKILGGDFDKVVKVEIKEYNLIRNIALLKKIALTPTKYPRGKNQAKLNPIK